MVSPPTVPRCLPRPYVAIALAAGLAFAVSCSSKTNNGANNKAASSAVNAAATAAKPVPSTASAGTPAPGTSPAAVIAQSFAPSGGSAAWVNVADGCHGVKAPANAEALKASDTGVTTTEIKLGTTQALSGSASIYAPIVKVMQDCFAVVNKEGGIYGRKLNLLVEDDQYTPANTKPLTQKLVEQDKIFADLSPLGTAENTQIYDYLNEQKVPQLFVATGATQWGADPTGHPFTVGYPPDYQTIGQNFAKYIQTNLKGKKVGILSQNDDFGRDYVTGLKKVLGDKGTPDNPIVGEEIYESTATDVTGQITNLKNKGAEVLYLIAIPKYAGLALKAAADQSWHPAVVLYEGAVDTTLPDLAGGKQNVEGVISAGWYHQAAETSSPAIQAVSDFLQKNDSNQQLSNWPVYGYILAQLYVESFKRAGVNPTRASLMQAVESFNNFTVAQLLPGVTVSTSKTDHRPIKCVQLSKAHDGVFTNFGDVICADK
ncbi:MAG: ABC transporter substrate-binding protein [Dehalococcoidia bacterium]